MKCSSVQKRKVVVCAGDMNDVIKIQNRSLGTPIFDSSYFSENFSSAKPSDPEEQLALVDSVNGKTFFNSVSETDETITHYVYINFEEDITAENWVEFEGNHLDVLSVENVGEANETLLLVCQEKGPITLNAAKK